MPATSFKSRITAIALARCSRLCNPFLNSYIESEQDELLVFCYAALSPPLPSLIGLTLRPEQLLPSCQFAMHEPDSPISTLLHHADQIPSCVSLQHAQSAAWPT